MENSTREETQDFELVLTREIDVPREAVWKAWTDPEMIKKWFTPAPWQTVACEMDLRPGGVFSTVMRSPEGEEFSGKGCFLEIVENKRLVWTDALGPGFVPSGKPFMTAVITLEDTGGGTRYTARVLHKDEVDREKHREMGFETGWAKALDQLIEAVRAL